MFKGCHENINYVFYVLQSVYCGIPFVYCNKKLYNLKVDVQSSLK